MGVIWRSAQGFLVAAGISFATCAFVISLLVNSQYGTQQQTIALLLQTQTTIESDIQEAQSNLLQINSTLSIISQEDIDMFQNDTVKIAEMYAIDAQLNTSALQTFNDLPGNNATVILTGSNGIVIVVASQVKIECTLDLDVIRATLITLQGELVGIDSQIPGLDASIVKNLSGVPGLGPGTNVTLAGECGVQVVRLSTNTFQLNGCNIVNYSSSVSQEISQTQQEVQQVENVNVNITQTLSQLIETITVTQQAVGNLSVGNVIKQINGLNTTTVNVFGGPGISVVNKPAEHTIEFNVSGLKSVNVNLTGPSVTIAGGSNVIVTTPSPNVIRFQSTARSYSSCYQDSGTNVLIKTDVITALNTWTPWIVSFSGYIGCPFSASNAPFTNTNCAHIANNPCNSGWALLALLLGIEAQPMFIVPLDGSVWKISLTFIMAINQKGPSGGPNGVGDWSTPQFGLSTDNSCATGISAIFGMSMLAADNFGIPSLVSGLTRSWTYYGEVTFITSMGGWVPGTAYYLCYLNIGQGYPGESAVATFPAAVRVV